MTHWTMGDRMSQTQLVSPIVSDYMESQDECYLCGRVAVATCDYVIIQGSDSKGPLICGRPTCQGHTHKPFRTQELEYCPEHCPCGEKRDWEECYRAIRSDPCVSYDVKRLLQVALDRDPLDALSDAKLIVSVLQARADAAVASSSWEG